MARIIDAIIQFFFLPKQEKGEMGQKNNKEASTSKKEKPAAATLASKL